MHFISCSFRIVCQACDLKRNIGIQAKLSCSFFSLREKYWMLWGGCWGSVCPTLFLAARFDGQVQQRWHCNYETVGSLLETMDIKKYLKNSPWRMIFLTARPFFFWTWLARFWASGVSVIIIDLQCLLINWFTETQHPTRAACFMSMLPLLGILSCPDIQLHLPLRKNTTQHAPRRLCDFRNTSRFTAPTGVVGFVKAKWSKQLIAVTYVFALDDELNWKLACREVSRSAWHAHVTCRWTRNSSPMRSIHDSYLSCWVLSKNGWISKLEEVLGGLVWLSLLFIMQL